MSLLVLPLTTQYSSSASLAVSLKDRLMASMTALSDTSRITIRQSRFQPRFYGDVCHATGVQRELCNQLFQSGKESAEFAGPKWMYDGIERSKLFQSQTFKAGDSHGYY